MFPIQSGFKYNYGPVDLKKNKKRQESQKDIPLDFYHPSENTEIYKDRCFPNIKVTEKRDPYFENLPELRWKYSTQPPNKRTLKLNDFDENPSNPWCKPKHLKLFQTIIIQCHGGAFIAAKSAHCLNYVFPWVLELDVPVFSIDYRLAPYARFPNIINDGINAYLWIIFFIKCVLKVDLKNIILTGDSAGGT